MRRQVIRILPVAILVVLTLLNRTEAAQTVDMYGRTVAFPDRIVKVIASSPPVTHLLYTIDPGLLGGLNLPPSRKQVQYLGKEVEKLPVVGGFGGPGRNFNAEVLLAARPDLVIVWPPHSGILNPMVRRILETTGIPYVLLRLDNIEDYPRAYEYLGKLLGREARGKELATYFRKELEKLQAYATGIPESERVSVYFAEGLDGLTTVSSDSVHGEALALAGGRNVYRVKPENTRFKDRISIEQVLAFDPEVIIVQEAAFFREIYRDSRWRKIKAVRNGRVFLEPDVPFSWLDRPPSLLRLLGAKWLAAILYPSHGHEKLASEIREFFKLFLEQTLSDEDLQSLLNRENCSGDKSLTEGT
jgi:iron complex transport system substrate-binding protein